MLLSLQIRNLALIENITIEFGEGLNILSGETGAGKSILVQAIEVLLGGRGSADLIRQGEEEAEISGLFECQGEEIGLRRVLHQSGRNRCYLNERPVTVANLAEVGAGLMEVAGQHEYQSLLRSEEHLRILDEYAGLQDEAAQHRELLNRFKNQVHEKEQLLQREREMREREEFLRFQVKELEQAALEEGEEEKLKQEREVLKNATRIVDICLRSEQQLEGDHEAASVKVGRVLREVQSLATIDPEFGSLGQQTEEALRTLEEVAGRLGKYAQSVAHDADRLQQVEDRLDLIRRLQRKYGGSVSEILAKKDEIQKNLALLENFDEEIHSRDQEIQKVGGQLKVMARELYLKREKGGAKLSNEVGKELKKLGMPAARFRVGLSEVLAEVSDGLSEGQGVFLFAPNPGEGEKELVRIASGGELSRVFLALKKVLINLKSAETCVFDEADTGVGGAVAEAVGKSLADLARMRQVICITHLPQIACYGDSHFVIQKREEKGRTLTAVQRLEKDQKELEIARMLAGIHITDRARDHAREMLRNAGIKGD